MKIKLLMALLLSCLLVSASAETDDESASAFVKFAKKLREETLSRLEPTVQTSGVHSSTGASRVLMVGDSMSVGAFGGVMADYLVSRFGRSNFALYASCGSSPESWMRSESDYLTHCGFRVQTPTRTEIIDYEKGHRPPLVRTPKIENLLAFHRPNLVIVQLGTNWMDSLMHGDSPDKLAGIIDRFVASIRSHSDVRQIIWITPPDSSHFSPRVQRTVEALIRDASHRDRFDTVISSAMTHYTPGRSGGDGIHYNSEPAEAWARLAWRDLSRKLR